MTQINNLKYSLENDLHQAIHQIYVLVRYASLVQKTNKMSNGDRVYRLRTTTDMLAKYPYVKFMSKRPLIICIQKGAGRTMKLCNFFALDSALLLIWAYI
jgi:hypothetical protein